MTTRGIRNNNPGNIRKGITWDGLARYSQMTEAQRDEKAFDVFVCATYGIRALARLLTVYYESYNLNTLTRILNRYAPDTENDTSAYATHVAKKTGFAVDEVIDVTDRKVLKPLIEAIILHENGSQPYGYEIDDGITLARRIV